MKPSRSLPITLTLPNWFPLSLPSIFVAKELRAVLPAAFFGVVLATLACIADRRLGLLVEFAYGISCAAIGSIAAGHDFIHRTLGTTLALPISREKIWRTRLFISFLAMLPLAILTGTRLFLAFDRLPSSSILSILVLQLCVPILSGLFVAPWLTLISRSALFGTVLTLCIPFLFATGINLMIFAFRIDHREGFQTVRFQTAMMAFLHLSYWLAGGILGWHKFMHLEAVENQTAISLRPSHSKRKAATLRLGTRRNPVRQLVKKELMLQRIPFAMVGCFIVVELCLLETQHLRPELGSDFPVLWTALCAPLLSILIGAVSSAEERQLGIAEWQILLPISSSKQWMVKVSVVLVMAALFGGLLPAWILSWVGKKGDLGMGGWSPFVVFAAIAIIFASVSLYISTLCNNAVKAMLVSLPVSLGVIVFLLYPAMSVLKQHPDAQISMGSWWANFLPLYFFLGGLIFALRMGMINHRSSDRGAGRILLQVGCLLAYMVMVSVVFFHLSGSP